MPTSTAVHLRAALLLFALAACPLHADADKDAAPATKPSSASQPSPSVDGVNDARLSFDRFDQRARAGDALNVVFFGGSLTWGSNATDPNVTSYRALTSERLREKYPKARFRFFDAALGGTGSQTAAYRLQRDVLRHRPDLVFLDFSLNDDLDNPSEDKLAAYESLIRRILLEGRCPVQTVILAGKGHVTRRTPAQVPGRLKHREIAAAYSVPIGDALEHIHGLIAAGKADANEIWPYDPIHPCDLGYQLYFDAAWQGFEAAVESRARCEVPAKMLRSDDYMHWNRVRISSLGTLPEGWTVTKPNVQAAYYDGLMSRRLDDETRASNGLERAMRRWGPADDLPPTGTYKPVQPLEVKFRGTSLLLLGERTVTSGKVRVIINGKAIIFNKRGDDFYEASAKEWHNNQFLAESFATGLAPGVEHTLRLEPVFAENVPQELRIESICVAGPNAAVWLEKK